MKKTIIKLLIFPALLAMFACGIGSEPINSNGDGDSIVTDGNNGVDPSPTPTPTDGPEIAEENPCQGKPGACFDIKKVDPSILKLVAMTKTEGLKDAIALHTAIIYGHKGLWLNASDQEKAQMIQKVDDAWDMFMGQKSLEALKADVENYPQETLDNFLQFYRYVVFNGPAEGWYRQEFEVVGTLNLQAFNKLKSAMEEVKNHNYWYGADDLEDFTDLLPKPYFVLQTAFFRISLESTFKRFGLKDYFKKVSASDEEYEDQALDFFLPLAKKVYDAFRNANTAPGQYYQTCNANPSCPNKIVDSYAVMVFEMPKLWENVVFAMTDANGNTQLFSFFNFINVPSNGKMFQLARGTFGAHKVENLKFAKDGEL